MNTRIVSHQAKIDNIVAAAGMIQEPFAQSQLAALVCVLACGYLEESTRTLLLDYCRPKGTAQLSSYVAYGSSSIAILLGRI